VARLREEAWRGCLTISAKVSFARYILFFLSFLLHRVSSGGENLLAHLDPYGDQECQTVVDLLAVPSIVDVALWLDVSHLPLARPYPATAIITTGLVQKKKYPSSVAYNTDRNYEMFIDLVSKMLACVPEDRIKPEEVLQHPFILSTDPPPTGPTEATPQASDA
jgi:serine/threonine protein kinase